MPHGAKDYGNIIHGEVTQGLYDMAELAVRLGAINSIDRLGNIIFFDDFSNGEGACLLAGNGTGSSVSVSGSRFKYGGFSGKLIAGSEVWGEAYCYYDVLYPELTKMGSEYNFSFDNSVSYIEFYTGLYTPTRFYLALVKLDLVNKKLQIRNSAGSWLDIVTVLPIYASEYLFHSMKIVNDFTTGYYSRMIFDSITYNLSSYLIGYTVGSYNVHIDWRFHIVTKVGYNGIAYLDSTILTRNEP